MTKIICDICGEEIKELSEHYTVQISSNITPNKYNLIKRDVCECCANSIYHYIEGLNPLDNDT